MNSRLRIPYEGLTAGLQGRAEAGGMRFGMEILAGMFVVGIAGSAVVAAISFIEDIKILFSRDGD
ncbi:MAG TPA: hypothetical protein VF392_14820 [Terracidiphilus sp.]